MPIFHSVGSNYFWQDTIKFLYYFLFAKKKAKELLVAQLNQQFKGQSTLFYKGRDALEYILLSYGIGNGDGVITQAFACYAIEEGIKRVGAVPIYVDLVKNKLFPSLTLIKQSYEQHPEAKAVLLQYTFGTFYPELKKIKSFCQHHNLLLIEDLAQAFGGVNDNQKILGSEADAILLSFGRDKILDAISGGAAILKNPPKIKLQANNWQKINLFTQLKDAVYPLLTILIRTSYNFGVGKILHFILKKIAWFNTPLFSPNQHIAKLPAFYAAMVGDCLNNLDAQLAHRKKIAEFYYRKLQKLNRLNLITGPNDLEFGTNLRFILTVQNSKSLLKFLAKEKIYLADRWYRKAVDCSSLKCQSVYQPGSCLNAEKLAKQIINLPTHKNINLKKATHIIQTIERWHDIQENH